MEKQNIPQLRFPEFNSEWEKKKLGDICKMQAGKFISASEIKSESDIDLYPCYGGNGLRGYTKTFNYNGKYSLIGRQGAHCGNVTLTYGKFYATEHAVVVSLKQGMDSDWTFYLLNNLNLNQYATGLAQPGLSVQNLEKVETIISPFLPEQEKIASFFTEIDQKITKLKQKKNLLEQYKKGVMQKIFSQELRFKDDNGNEFPEWEEKKLGEVSDVRDGTHDSPKYVDQGFPFITSKNLLKNGSIDFNNVSFISENDYKKFNQRSKVDINDILFGMIGTIGNPVLVNSDGFAIKNVALIKEKKQLLNNFLIHFLNSHIIHQQFFEQNTGGTQKFLSLTIIRNLDINVPSLTEQTKIANFLSAIDEKINQAQKQIEKAENWKKGLLQKMFV